MRRLMLCSLVVLLGAVLVTGCGTSFFSGGTAKQNALQALVTTTRSAVLLMTAAGIAYDAGAFGAPGSPGAEATWGKIAQQSVLMSNALNDWQTAVKANKDASAYQSIVAQGLAVLGALLPAASRSAVERIDPVTLITFRPDQPQRELWMNGIEIAQLSCPEHYFRSQRTAFAGGAR